MMNEAIQLPGGYYARSPNLGDAAAVAALRAACEQLDHGRATTTADEVRETWAGVDLRDEAIVVCDGDGEVAAYADVYNRAFVQISVYGFVHPDHQGRGIGAYLAAWGEVWAHAHLAEAPPAAQVAVQHYIPARNEAARRLLGSRDYAPVRGVYEMGIEFDGRPPEPVWPAGIAVRPFIRGRDERPSFDVYEEASEDMWDRPRGTWEAWLAYTARADPAFLFLAVETDGGAIAGVNACTLVDGRGYVGGLRVRPRWRRQGLGLALLHHAFVEFYRHGAREAGLSVDAASPTNAPALYLRAGMRVVREYAIYRKIVRPGSGPDHG